MFEGPSSFLFYLRDRCISQHHTAFVQMNDCALPDKQTAWNMSLSRIPNELVLCIAESLESDADINAFVRANRCLYALANPHLYRRQANKTYRSPLLKAARTGQEGTMRKLLEAGAGLNVRDALGMTALSMAAAQGHEHLVKLLLDRDGIDLYALDIEWQWPLSCAATSGNINVVKLLLDRGEPEPPHQRGQTPLLLAMAHGETR